MAMILTKGVDTGMIRSSFLRRLVALMIILTLTVSMLPVAAAAQEHCQDYQAMLVYLEEGEVPPADVLLNAMTGEPLTEAMARELFAAYGVAWPEDATPTDLDEASPTDLEEATPCDLEEASPSDLEEASPADLDEASLSDLDVSTFTDLPGVTPCDLECDPEEETPSDLAVDVPVEEETTAVPQITLQPGDLITMGSYEQDNDLTNGAEPIQWRVLKVEEDKVLVITQQGLDTHAFQEGSMAAAWADSSIRLWLMNSFVPAAFTAEELSHVLTTAVSTPKHPDYDTDPGPDTMDQLFLLSVQEATEYFDGNADRRLEATAYAIANGTWSSMLGGGAWWWLRTPGADGTRAAYVSNGGPGNIK